MRLRLATLSDGSRDGVLVVSRAETGEHFFRCGDRYPTMLAALEKWELFEADLASGAAVSGPEVLEVDVMRAGPALRRTWQALFASAYGNRAVRVAQTAMTPSTDESVKEAPLMYQGASAGFLGPGDALDMHDADAELDLEPEIAIVTDYVPQATTAREAHRHIRLVALINDFTYRAIVRRERELRFGFIQGKPASAMAPIALTPAALGACWRDGVLHASVAVARNGEMVGRMPTHEMHFDFAHLIEHAATTRSLPAGTLISSGTVSSIAAEGAASLIELRALQRSRAEALTPFLQDADTVAINVMDDQQRSLFGKLENWIRVGAGAKVRTETQTARTVP